MDVNRSAIYFVSRYQEHPPATLQELLKASTKRNSVVAKAAKMDETRECEVEQNPVDIDDQDSDSDYQCVDDEDGDDDLDDSDPEVDEWRLHANDPREGLYLDEMRRQRSCMDEKEAMWVRGYVKAQRAWKARTGCSIDAFDIPGSAVRRMKKDRLLERNRALKELAQKQEKEEEENGSLFVGVTRLETLLLVAAIVFVCLSLGVQLYALISNEVEATNV